SSSTCPAPPRARSARWGRCASIIAQTTGPLTLHLQERLMWFRANNQENPSPKRAHSPPPRRRQPAADRRRESRRLLLESLEERRVLTFVPAVDYDVGDNPQALVSGDF